MNGRDARATPEWQEAKRVWDNVDNSFGFHERLAAMGEMARIESEFAKGVRA